MSSTLRSYQEPHVEKLVQALRQHRAVLDQSDTGTGKTFCALATCARLKTIPLVVGPLSAGPSWERASVAMGQPIQYINYEKLRGSRRWVLETEERTYRGTPVLGPFAERKLKSEWVDEVKSGKGSFVRWLNRYDTIVFDEVHRGGGEKSLIAKSIVGAKRQAHKLITLSATAADDPRQMKALGYALGLHELNGKKGYVPWLLRRGCSPGVFGGFDFTEDYDEQQVVFTKLHTELAHCSARMVKSQIPGFPKTQIGSKMFTDDGSAARLTARIQEKHAWLVARSNEIADCKERDDGAKVASVLEEILRLYQALELRKVPHLIDAARDYSRTSKVVLFVNYTDTLQEIRAALGDKCGFVDGSQTTNTGQRQAFIDTFQRDELDYMICNNQAGSESINLHGRAERTALISAPQSGRRLKQILGRVHRDGGSYSQQFICFFAGTAEEANAMRVDQKCSNIDALNGEVPEFSDADLTII